MQPLKPSLPGPRPRVSLFFVFVVFMILAVSCVASFSSMLTYAIGFEAVNTAGVECVKANLISTVLDIESYLSPLQREAAYVKAIMTSAQVIMPNASSDPFSQLAVASQAMNTVIRSRPSAFGIAAIAFGDASWAATYTPLPHSPALQYQVVPAANGKSCGGTVHKRYFNLSTNADLTWNQVKSYAFAFGESGCRYDVLQGNPYYTSDNLTSYGLPFAIPNTTLLMFPYYFSVPVLNGGSTPDAIAILSISNDAIVSYLRAAVTNGIADAAILVDTAGRVVASTLTDRPFTWVAPPALRAELCTTFGNLDVLSTPTCLYKVVDYGYGPAVAAFDAGFFNDATYPHFGAEDTVETRDIKVQTFYDTTFHNGDTVVIGCARLRADILGYYVVLFVGGQALHGDLDTAQTELTVLGSVCAVVSIVIIAFTTYVVLRRLRCMTDQVRVAALFHAVVGARRPTDVTPPAAYSYIAEVRSLEAAQQNLTVFYKALSGYMPKDVLRTLTLGGAPDLETQVKCAVLSADFTGFGSACYGLNSYSVTTLSTLLYNATLEVLQVTAGTLLHFSGDGFIAGWGTGRKVPNTEARAGLAAALLQRALRTDKLVDPFVDVNEMPFVHIGLHCGVATVGVVGTPERLTLNVIGDLVQQATRLKARAALYDTRPMSSEPFMKRLGKLFVTRQLVFPVEIDTDVQTAVTRRDRTSTLMNSMRVVKSFELVGLASTESPDDLSRMRINDNRVNLEVQEAAAAREEAIAADAKRGANHGSKQPTAKSGVEGDRSVPTFAGSVDAREAPGAYNTVQLFDGVRVLPECPLEPNETELSYVKAYNQVSRAFLKGRFSTVGRRAKRIIDRLAPDDPYVSTLQILVAMAQKAEIHTKTMR